MARWSVLICDWNHLKLFVGFVLNLRSGAVLVRSLSLTNNWWEIDSRGQVRYGICHDQPRRKLNFNGHVKSKNVRRASFDFSPLAVSDKSFIVITIKFVNRHMPKNIILQRPVIRAFPYMQIFWYYCCPVKYDTRSLFFYYVPPQKISVSPTDTTLTDITDSSHRRWWLILNWTRADVAEKSVTPDPHVSS